MRAETPKLRRKRDNVAEEESAAVDMGREDPAAVKRARCDEGATSGPADVEPSNTGKMPEAASGGDSDDGGANVLESSSQEKITTEAHVRADPAHAPVGAAGKEDDSAVGHGGQEGRVGDGATSVKGVGRSGLHTAAATAEPVLKATTEGGESTGTTGGAASETPSRETKKQPTFASFSSTKSPFSAEDTTGKKQVGFGAFAARSSPFKASDDGKAAVAEKSDWTKQSQGGDILSEQEKEECAVRLRSVKQPDAERT